MYLISRDICGSGVGVELRNSQINDVSEWQVNFTL